MSTFLKSLKTNMDFTWNTDTFPCYADLDLEQICMIDKIVLTGNMTAANHCNFRLYGSNDGISFYRFSQDGSDCLTADTNHNLELQASHNSSCRYLRLQIVHCTSPLSDIIKEVQIFGNTTDDRGCKTEWMTPPAPFSETDYASPITKKDTEAYLYGMVERTAGSAYQQWFSFHLTEEPGNDRFSIYAGQGSESGKVCIEGNTGVALAVGLNYYYKNFCNVHISEQEMQVKMPPYAILPMAPIHKTAVDSLRYAYNYCTLSYTMSFWGEKEWQKELDWLALNGVNLVLDFTGIEAVWYQFLREFDYSDKEIRNWIVGPCYTAWQSMQNMEGFGGPIHPSFILDRVKLARCNQRKMRILGMHPILQNYAGMVPTTHNLHDPEAVVYPQGTWNGMKRPSLLDPTTHKYHIYAKRFYEIQAQIYGSESHYYAVDPFHEGGIRPETLTDDKIAVQIMENLLEFDPKAVWIVQAWRENPTSLFLEGVRDYRREHMLILDLSATDNPSHTTGEFQETPWIYCMLDMYGGRLSTHGEPDVLAEEIPKIRQKTQHMKGIGFTSEATCHNPVTFELLFEMAWEDTPVEINTWIQSYARRRYGFLKTSIEQGWKQLLKTAYHNPGFSHHGGYTQIFTYRPRLSMERGYVFNELNSSVIKNPYYDPKEFYLAVKCFCDAFDTYKDSACYIYDLQDLLRQTLNLFGTESAFSILDAYHAKDISQFNQASDCFLNLIDICDQLMQIRKDYLLGDWIGYAIDYGRQYGGLLKEYYQKRWQTWIEHLRQALIEENEAEELSPETWFRSDWKFVIDTQTIYPRTPASSDSVLKEAISTVQTLAAQFWNL